MKTTEIMFGFMFNKVFKRYRIANNRKQLLQNKSLFIEQLKKSSSKHQTKSDQKEIFFYPLTLHTSEDIKQTKLLLILGTENGFICNGETHTDNNKINEYQLKLKNINDHFYHECYSNNTRNEKFAHDMYAEINELLSASNTTQHKMFTISSFLNFWHFSLSNDGWKMFDCELETDEFVLIKYKLVKKPHKNYCFNPVVLFGASKENLHISFQTDDSFYYCVLRIALVSG